MNINREVGCFLCSITQAHSCNHIALSGDSHTRTTPLTTLLLNLLPKMILCTLHLINLRVSLYLRHNEVDFLHFKVDDIVHQTLCELCMTLEQFHIEACMISEWVDNIRIEIQRKESTAIVRAEWNLTTWVR